MTGLFDLLASALQTMFAWLPRPLYVPAKEAAVVWTGGRPAKVKRGLLVVVPLFQAWEIVDCRQDATPFEPTVLWTRDGKEIAIAGVLTWRVKDPLRACSEVNDLTDFVGEKLESLFPELVGRYTLAELVGKAVGGEGREWALNRHLLTSSRTMLEPYGIEVLDARVNFTARTRVYRLIGGGIA